MPGGRRQPAWERFLTKRDEIVVSLKLSVEVQRQLVTDF
jgi:hypothetical protein